MLDAQFTPFDTLAFSRHLDTQDLGRVEIYTAESGSTNDDARDAALRGTPAGAIFVTDHQRDGRGQHGRRWQAPPGSSILASLLVRPTASVLPYLTIAANVAVAEALEPLLASSQAHLTIKWPNDMLLDNAKLAGVLVEARGAAGTAEAGKPFAVIGLGLNWRVEDGACPALASRFASLHRSLQPLPPREVILARILNHLEPHLRRLSTGDSEPTTRAWRQRLQPFGRAVRIMQGDRVTLAITDNVTASGALVARRCSDGALLTVYTGSMEETDGQEQRVLFDP